MTGEVVGSHVAGARRRSRSLQRAPQRYYQRPDATTPRGRSARTSLRGYSGRVFLNRNSGVWRVNAALWGVSPGFESNDLGFHSRGDRAGAHGVLLWRKQTPDRFTRSRGWWLAKAWTWNFNRELLSNLWMGCADATLTNYWSVERLRRILASHPARRPHARRTAGREPAKHVRQWRLQHRQPQMDCRSASLAATTRASTAGSAATAKCRVTLKPLSSLSISTGPSLNRSRNLAQYLQTEERSRRRPTFGNRYVFGTIDQKQLTLQTRVNWILESTNVAAGLHAAAAGDGPLRRLQGAGRAAHVRLLRIRHAGVIASRTIHSPAPTPSTRTTSDRRRRSPSTIPTSTSSRCA